MQLRHVGLVLPALERAVPLRDRRRMYRYVTSMPGAMIRTLLAACISALTAGMLATAVSRTEPISYAAPVVLVLSGWFAFIYAWRATMRRLVVCALSAHGYACEKCRCPFGEMETECPRCGAPRADKLCTECGYSLRGLAFDIRICPECGAQCQVRQPILRSWLFFQFLDRRLVMNPRQRWRVHRLALGFAIRRFIWSVVLGSAFLLAAISSYYALIEAERIPLMSELHPLLFAHCALALWILAALAARWLYAPCLWRAACQLGHNVCSNCGYYDKFKSDHVDRCPECGRSIETSRD